MTDTQLHDSLLFSTHACHLFNRKVQQGSLLIDRSSRPRCLCPSNIQSQIQRQEETHAMVRVRCERRELLHSLLSFKHNRVLQTFRNPIRNDDLELQHWIQKSEANKAGMSMLQDTTLRTNTLFIQATPLLGRKRNPTFSSTQKKNTPRTWKVRMLSNLRMRSEDSPPLASDRSCLDEGGNGLLDGTLRTIRS
jgi:hypothetical protein